MCPLWQTSLRCLIYILSKPSGSLCNIIIIQFILINLLFLDRHAKYTVLVHGHRLSTNRLVIYSSICFDIVSYHVYIDLFIFK